MRGYRYDYLSKVPQVVIYFNTSSQFLAVLLADLRSKAAIFIIPYLSKAAEDSDVVFI